MSPNSKNKFKSLHWKEERSSKSSAANRRKSIRMERKQRREEQINSRRPLAGLSVSPITEPLDISQTTSTTNTGKSPSNKLSMQSKKEIGALDLKQKLQLWREEKKKQQEKNKKSQTTSFVVKKLERAPENDLYRKTCKEEKKLPRPAMNINFVQKQKDDTKASCKAKSAFGAKQITDKIEKSQNASKKEEQRQLGQGRGLRQKESKNCEQKSEAIANKKKVQVTQNSKQQDSTAKPKHSRGGDLHCRLTAAAAAKKQGNDGKAKDFLRAKSRTMLLTSQSLPKQSNRKGTQPSNSATARKKDDGLYKDAQEEMHTKKEANLLYSQDESSVKTSRRSARNTGSASVDGDGKESSSDEKQIMDQLPNDKNRKLKNKVDNAVEELNDKVALTPNKKFKESLEVSSHTKKERRATPGRRAKLSQAPALFSGEENNGRIEVSDASNTKSSISVTKFLPICIDGEADIESQSKLVQEKQNTTPRKTRRSVIARTEQEEARTMVQTNKTPSRKPIEGSTNIDPSNENEQAGSFEEAKFTSSRKSKRSMASANPRKVQGVSESNEFTYNSDQSKGTPGLEIKPTPSKRQRSSDVQTMIETPGTRSKSLLTVNEEDQIDKTDVTPSRRRKLSVAESPCVSGEEQKRASKLSISSRRARKSYGTPLREDDIHKELSPFRKAHVEVGKRQSVRRSLMKKSSSPFGGSDSAPINFATADDEKQRNVDDLNNSKAETGVNFLDTQTDLGSGSAFISNKYTDEKRITRSAQRSMETPSRRASSSRKGRASRSSNRHRQSKSRRSVACIPSPGMLTPFRHSRSKSTVVSVSEEGTANLKGDDVVGEAVTPERSFIENQVPGSTSRSCNTKSHKKETMKARTDKGTPEGTTVYRLAKPDGEVSKAKPLQELTVEKVEGEVSFIEIPLDESNASASAMGFISSPKQEHMASPLGISEVKSDSVNSSSGGTEPFTPSKSTDTTTSSQGSLAANDTPLPPRLPVRDFKTPHQAPPSARQKSSARRSRRKTVHTPLKTPEQMVKILAKSPMVEMTRRRSRHVSSPASVEPLGFGLEKMSTPVESTVSKANTSAPELTDVEVYSVVKTTSTVPHDADHNKPVVGSSEKKSVGESGAFSVGSEVAEKVKHFRNLIVSETKRLNDMCDSWIDISSGSSTINEEACGHIRTAVGKAQLLIDQRFKQFSGLVDNCEFNLGELKTKPEDLQGFWEMIYFQVEDVNGLFDSLKVLKDNNWVEKKKTPPKPVLKKKPVARATKPKGKSNFMAFRQEMMMRKAQQKVDAAQTDKTIPSDTAIVEKEKESEKAQSLEFDGGFFLVSSPSRSATGKRSTLTPAINTSAEHKSVVNTSLEDKTEPTKEAILVDPSPSQPFSADKENSPSARTVVSTTCSGSSTPKHQHQTRLGLSGKRLSYVPVVPSPLLNDITGVKPSKKL